MTEGVQFRDQANQMRLDEYQTRSRLFSGILSLALALARAGLISTWASVCPASTWRAAERVGLVGLFWFLGLLAAFYTRSVPAMRHITQARPERGAALLGLQAGYREQH